MELIDTHCHLSFAGLIGDIDGVIERSKASGVSGWVTVGTDMAENAKVIELAGRYENMYAAVGVHPHYAKDVGAETVVRLAEMAKEDRVVAIGETGYDFHYNHSSRQEQERVFAAQLEVAAKSNLPVIVHSREAFEETLYALERYGSDLGRVVFHCFTGSADEARVLLERGYYISYTGVVTFLNAEGIAEAAKVTPLERMMIETDCPFMSPAPMRKQKINEPGLMVHTARFLSELKGLDLADFAQAVSGTTRKFFKMPGG